MTRIREEEDNVSADCLSRIFSEMSEAARAEFTPTAEVKDDFVVTVQQQEQAAPLIEDTVPVDGRSRDLWQAYELCHESRDIRETSTSTSSSILDPNATPYSPRHLTAETADYTADSDIRVGQFQNTLSEGFDFNCAVDSDLEAFDPNNGNNDQLNINSFDIHYILHRIIYRMNNLNTCMPIYEKVNWLIIVKLTA